MLGKMLIEAGTKLGYSLLDVFVECRDDGASIFAAGGLVVSIEVSPDHDA